MPKVVARSDVEIGALASEVRSVRLFEGSGVVPWLRANLDLIIALRVGRWSPTDQQIIPASGRWTYNDIARALASAGVTFRNGRLTGPVLKNRMAELMRDPSVLPGVGPLEAVRRVVTEALEAHGLIQYRAERLDNPARLMPTQQNDQTHVSAAERPAISDFISHPQRSSGERQKELSKIYTKPRPSKLVDVVPVVLTHEDRQGLPDNKK